MKTRYLVALLTFTILVGGPAQSDDPGELGFSIIQGGELVVTCPCSWEEYGAGREFLWESWQARLPARLIINSQDVHGLPRRIEHVITVDDRGQRELRFSATGERPADLVINPRVPWGAPGWRDVISVPFEITERVDQIRRVETYLDESGETVEIGQEARRDGYTYLLEFSYRGLAVLAGM